MTETTVSARPTAVIAAATTWEQFASLWAPLLAEVWEVVSARSEIAPGRNVMLYRDDVPNVEVGVELDGTLSAPSGRVVASALPAGRAATTVARGAPSPGGIAAAHAAVVEWCDANGHSRTGVRWEVYDHWRDDPDTFETAVHWLLAS